MNGKEEACFGPDHGTNDESRLLSSLLDEMSEGAFVWGVDGKCIRVNRAACAMLGYKKEEILGTYFLDHVRTEDSHGYPIQPESGQSIERGPVRSSLVTIDGSLLPVEIVQRLLSDGSVAVIVHDITGRKRNEEAIRNVNRLYATLSGINHAIVRNKDKKTLFNTICQVAVERGEFDLAFVGVIREDGRSMDIVSWTSADGREPGYDVLDLANPPLDESVISDCLRTGEVSTSNVIQRYSDAQFPEMKNAQRTFTSSACVPIRTKGAIAGMVILGRNDDRNITEQERSLFSEIGEDVSFALDMMEIESERVNAGVELAESERKFRTITEQMNDAVIVITDLGQVAYVSQAAVPIIGFTPEEITGRHFSEFLYHEDNEKAFSYFMRVLELGESAKDIALRLVRKDGLVAHCEVDATPYKNSELTGIIGVVRDVSERVRAAEELKLGEEKRVDLERQLIQVQRLESLGTLAGGIAHDFNNLLGIITGYSSLLQKRKNNDQKLTRGLASIRKAAERGATLVKQLLTIARETETVFRPVSVNDLIDEITKLLVETFPKTINLSTSLKSDLAAIDADASQLHQVIMNLCINSRDAMPLGGELRISTDTVEGDAVREKFPAADSALYLALTVADTGTGMSRPVQEKIFDPFFTTKMPGKGTGLGLALVYSIVKSHRGFISVESEQGKGTVFSLYFPIPAQASITAPSVDDAPDENRGGSETVLVIEDEEMLLDIIRNILVPKGYSVLTARDGEDGLRVYTQNEDNIDLIISDLGLPILSGEELVNRILSKNPGANIMVASGFIDPDTKTSLTNVGVRKFVNKPYSAGEVLAAVREALDSVG